MFKISLSQLHRLVTFLFKTNKIRLLKIYALCGMQGTIVIYEYPLGKRDLFEHLVFYNLAEQSSSVWAELFSGSNNHFKIQFVSRLFRLPYPPCQSFNIRLHIRFINNMYPKKNQFYVDFLLISFSFRILRYACLTGALCSNYVDCKSNGFDEDRIMVFKGHHRNERSLRWGWTMPLFRRASYLE